MSATIKYIQYIPRLYVRGAQREAKTTGEKESSFTESQKPIGYSESRGTGRPMAGR